jgi:SAM-dependent methyltransferase
MGPTTRRRPTGAGRAALHAYRVLPRSARLHAAVRWWSAPFPALEAHVPSSGRILEIGCGHGLFCTYLALAGSRRNVVGVDIDAAKIAQAQQVADRLDGVDLRFEVSSSGAVAPGPWDAIAIVDMLYLLPERAQRDLLTAAAGQLAPGGMLMIKEMSPTPRWKASWNRVQETLSVSVLGITARDDHAPDPSVGPAPTSTTGGHRRASGPTREIDQGADKGRTGADESAERFVFVSPATMAGWLRELGLDTTAIRLDRHRVHPHHLLIGRFADPTQ